MTIILNIAEEIQQKSFKSEHEKAFINLLFTASWISSKQIKFFKPFGLSPQQYNVLRILKGQYPNSINVSDVQSRMLDKMSNASRLIDKLLSRELVSREMCDNDRRRMDILITQKGLAVLKDIDAQKNIINICCVDEDEAKILNELLDKFRTK